MNTNIGVGLVQTLDPGEVVIAAFELQPDLVVVVTNQRILKINSIA